MGSLVMASAGVDFQNILYNLKDDSVGGIDTDAPFAGKIALERFGIANTTVAVSLNAFEKIVDAAEGFGILRLPFSILGPRAVVPEFFHATALRRRLFSRLGFVRGCISSLSSTSMRSW